jgi:hypothetical protein
MTLSIIAMATHIISDDGLFLIGRFVGLSATFHIYTNVECLYYSPYPQSSREHRKGFGNVIKQ